jgi:hypothetical protein
VTKFPHVCDDDEAHREFEISFSLSLSLFHVMFIAGGSLPLFSRNKLKMITVCVVCRVIKEQEDKSSKQLFLSLLPGEA